MGFIPRFGQFLPGCWRLGWLGAGALVLVFSAGCHHVQPVDVQPLFAAGMNFDSVKQLKTMDLSISDVSEIAQARQAGFSDAACVQVFQIYRLRKQPFDAGDEIGGLLRAGASEALVLNLARLNQLGLASGELLAMRLAGLSDDILLAVAQRHANGQPVLSGASLAGMKNLGMRSDTLLQLAQRGVPESDASAIMAARRHGLKDDAILRQFSGS